MPKISVVVPIYGVEKYIERCARSLLEQTLEDMEYVFVDDCTKDNSMEVLEKVIEEYPNRRNQVKIVHHEKNKGLSYARETGVKNSTGDYIGHCDSDDWVDKDMYETLYNEAKAKQLDLIRCNYRITDGENIIAEGRFRAVNDMENKTKMIGLVISDQGWNSIWCTLVSRSVYENNNILYTSQPMLEDMFVVLQLMTYSSKIGYVNKMFYNYYYNRKSISKSLEMSAIIKRAESAYENILWMIDFIKNRFNILELKNEIVFLKSIPRRDLLPALADKSNYKYWDNFFHEIGLSPFFSRYLSKSLRKRYLLAYCRVYPLFCSVKGKWRIAENC